MSSAKRRINWTGRKRIGREKIDIRLQETPPDESLQVKVALDLGEYNFPGSAKVGVEAYRRSSSQRFDCGTVEQLEIPEVLCLDDVDHDGSIKFRVTVVDNDGAVGRLLGSAERIPMRSPDEGEGRRSLFPVAQRDLGSVVWKVEVDDDNRPELILNSRIPGFIHRLTDNRLIQGVMLPAALRVVVEWLVNNPVVDDDDEMDWKADWLRYCSEILEVSDDLVELDEEEKRDWVEDVMQRFSEQANLVSNMKHALEESS